MGTVGVVSYAIPLFVLAAALTGTVVTVVTVGMRRNQRARVATLVLALADAERSAAELLLRAGRMAVRWRWLGWVAGIGAALLIVTVLRAGLASFVLAFACGYLAALALGEALMPKPARGEVHTAQLDPRSVRDYAPRWVMLLLHAATVVGLLLCAITIVLDYVFQHSLTVTCTVPQLNRPITLYREGPSTPWQWAVGAMAGYLAAWLAAQGVLRLIARRARPSGHPTLVYLDDTLRRAAALRVTAACLGTELITMGALFSGLSHMTDLPPVCPGSSSSPFVAGIFSNLYLFALAGGLVVLFVLPSSRRQFEPVRTAPERPAQPAPQAQPEQESE
ncbi:MAG TPA: hypothetical protein VGM10_19495 [Actinocrinis sp.]|jgi:hypothetical protein